MTGIMKKILSLLIVCCTFIASCIEIFVPYGDMDFMPHHNLFIYLLWQITCSISLYPVLLFDGAKVFALWHLLILILGIGLLMSNNFLRQIFVVLCIFLVCVLIPSTLVSIYYFVPVLTVNCLSVLWPIVYLRFFKQQF